MLYNDTYNEGNLNEQDRRAVQLMENAIDEAINTAEIEETGIPSIDKLMDDVAEAVKASVRANFEAIMYNIVVTAIEGYEEDGENKE